MAGDFLIGDGREKRLLTARFWMGQYGEALSYVERRITETTRMNIGEALTPHRTRIRIASASFEVVGIPPLKLSRSGDRS
jgi:hypothetical protein